jgi:hypothetical protein
MDVGLAGAGRFADFESYLERREQSPRVRLKTTARVEQREKIGVIHRKSEDQKCLLLW